MTTYNDAQEVQPLTLSYPEFRKLVGYSDNTTRQLLREGKLPGPIDSSIKRTLWRWSRAKVERFIDGGAPDEQVAS